MIIFKCKIEKAVEISDMQILCTNNDDIDWDYEIKGEYKDDNVFIKICLTTIFMNPDK